MTLTWHDDLAVGVDFMDRDHQDLLLLLARFPGTGREQFVALFAEVAHHLEQHFRREDDLMQQHGFFAYDCHHGEHQSVLAQVEALLRQALAGDDAAARQFIETRIGPWFITHRNTMDLVTARFVRNQA